MKALTIVSVARRLNLHGIQKNHGDCTKYKSQSPEGSIYMELQGVGYKSTAGIVSVARRLNLHGIPNNPEKDKYFVTSQSPEGSIYMESVICVNLANFFAKCLSRPKAQSTWNSRNLI